MKKDIFPAEGIVAESLPNAMFRVKITKTGEEHKAMLDKQVLATLAGKMRMYHIQVLPGDRVDLEISTYDRHRGRIIYRYK